MRITFVHPCADLSGGTRVVATYAQHLADRGHEVLVVCPPPRQPIVYEKIRSMVRGRGWPRQRVAGPSHLVHGTFERRVINLWRRISNADVPDADVVIATWWETAEWIASLSKGKGVPIHLVQGDDREIMMCRPRSVQRIEQVWRSSIQKIAVSQWVAGCLRSVSPEAEVEVIPNGVDCAQFEGLRRSLQQTRTFGFVFSPLPCKGSHDILKALEIAGKSIGPHRIVSFGTCAPGPEFAWPSNAEFHLMPPQRDIKNLYAQCDAWLFGSRSEGFGLPILEAMACRTPVIATPAGAAPELLESGSGILVDPESPTSMADAIRQVCHMSPDQWRVMSDAAHAAARRYSWDVATDRFERVLQMAARRSSAKAGSPPRAQPFLKKVI